MIKKFEEFIFELHNCKNFEIRKHSSLNPLNESQESESQKSAIKLVMDRFGWDKERANHFVRVDLRNDITALRDKQIGKFTLGVTRMYVDGELRDANRISSLNSTLKLLSAHLNEYDRNLNGLSVNELISKFKKVRENNVEREKREISKIKFGVSEYDIVKIDSFSDAKKYYTYTNPSSRWCLTHKEGQYNSYTCDGINQIYFCLKNGFEDVKPISGENTPLDDYGLSMLSIIVNENGELAYCTCRWNHANGGNDSVMDAVEISKVVNVDFYEVFKPNTKWKDLLDNVKNRLKNGETYDEIFDKVTDFNDDFNRVKLGNKWNLINKDGDFLFDKWLSWISNIINSHICCDYAKIILNKKCNIINGDGKLLSKEWLNCDEISISRYYCGESNYVKVWTKKYVENNENIDDNDENYEIKQNLINENWELVFSNEWFNNIHDFKNGFAIIELNEKCNIVDIYGKIVSNKWFDSYSETKEYLEKINK